MQIPKVSDVEDKKMLPVFFEKYHLPKRNMSSNFLTEVSLHLPHYNLALETRSLG